MTMQYRPVPISKVVAETPEWAQGDTTANPMPAPSDNNTSVNAREATAPAATAAHETPAIAGSITSSATPIGRIVCSMVFSRPFDFDNGQMLELPQSSVEELDLGRERLSCFDVLLPMIHQWRPS